MKPTSIPGFGFLLETVGVSCFVRPWRCGKAFPDPTEVSNVPVPWMALTVRPLLRPRPWGRGVNITSEVVVLLGRSCVSRCGLGVVYWGPSWLEVLVVLDLGIARGCVHYCINVLSPR